MDEAVTVAAGDGAPAHGESGEFLLWFIAGVYLFAAV